LASCWAKARDIAIKMPARMSGLPGLPEEIVTPEKSGDRGGWLIFFGVFGEKMPILLN